MKHDLHILNYQVPKNGRNVRTECGCWVEATDVAKQADNATCPECKAVWARFNADDEKTAEEMFG